MSLIFSEDLTGGNKGNFDVEVIGDGISYAGGECAMTIPVADADTYLQCDSAIVDSTPHIHVKFKAKVDDLTFGSTNRGMNFFTILDGIQQALWLDFNASGAELSGIRVQYQRNGTNFSNIYPVTMADNTYSEFEIFFQEQYSTEDSGRIRVKVDGVSIIDIALSDQHTSRNFVDKISFGNDAGSNVATPRILYIKDVELSPSSAFESGVSNYHVDNVSGGDGNTGTEASPLKNAGNITKVLLAGDTLTLVNNGEANPHRLIAGNNGIATIETAGTATALVTIESDTGRACITTCHGVGSGQNYQWNASGSNGEYYVTLTGGGDPSILTPSFIALGEASNNFEDLRRVFADGNTAGSLSAGEFAFGDNDTLGYSVVYYKPLTTEIIATLRAEINRNSIGIEFSTDYTTVRNLKPRMCGTGILDSGSFAGSAILNCDAGYSRTYGLQSDGGACLIQGNESHNSQSHVLGSGSEVGGGITRTGGSTSLAQGNHCHDNADDGMDVEGVGTDVKTYGNRLINNGYNSTDGTGLEVASNVTGCDTCNNEASGNSNRGLSFAANVSFLLKNNNVHDEDSTGLWFGAGVTMANVDAESNNLYNNPTDVNDGAATGSYSSTGDLVVEPDLDSSGTPNITSALVGAAPNRPGTGAWLVGTNGVIFSNVNRDIGGNQSTHSPTHPKNT